MPHIIAVRLASSPATRSSVRRRRSRGRELNNSRSPPDPSSSSDPRRRAPPLPTLTPSFRRAGGQDERPRPRGNQGCVRGDGAPADAAGDEEVRPRRSRARSVPLSGQSRDPYPRRGDPATPRGDRASRIARPSRPSRLVLPGVDRRTRASIHSISPPSHSALAPTRNAPQVPKVDAPPAGDANRSPGRGGRRDPRTYRLRRGDDPVRARRRRHRVVPELRARAVDAGPERGRLRERSAGAARAGGTRAGTRCRMGSGRRKGSASTAKSRRRAPW